jgi:hypothetical protein
MKAAPNRYHCNSSQAFDEVLKTFRITALPALTTIARKISQPMAFPMISLIPSMTREIPSNAPIRPPRCVLKTCPPRHLP